MMNTIASYNFQNDLDGILRPVLKKWHCNLPNNPCRYFANTHEFGKEIQQLLIAAKVNEKKIDPIKSALAGKTFWRGITFYQTSQNMQRIAQHLGIIIKEFNTFSYIRDCYIRLSDSTVTIPHHSPHLETAIMRTHSSNIYLSKTAAMLTTNQFFNNWSGQTNRIKFDAKEDIKTFGEAPTPFRYTYVEGGNVFITHNLREELKILIGADHLIHTLQLLELEKRSWQELALTTSNQPFETLQNEAALALTPSEIRRLAEEMFAEDLLLQNGKSGLISPKDQLEMMMVKFFLEGIKNLKEEEKARIEKQIIAQEKRPAFELQDSEIEKMRAPVAAYVAKKKITKELIALDFKVDVSQLHFIPQVNYHLDTFMAPGPNHSLFLINFAIWVDIFEALRNSKDIVKLSTDDEGHLQRYLDTAKKLDRELGPLLKEVENDLKEAGFTVVLMPGALFYESKTVHQEFPMPSGGYNINFINSLTGWSSQTKKYYYIAHGIQVGQNLGACIMDAFTLFLRDYVPDIEVYFIGRDPDNESDFSEAMDWWNRLETQSGIHCTTFELLTQMHRTS